MSDNLICCQGLSKAYGRKVALSGVDLEVGRGRIVGLLGPNGSGKTTLIKLLCGLIQPTTGTLAVDGQPIGVETKARISYLPDRMYFANWMRAIDLFDFDPYNRRAGIGILIHEEKERRQGYASEALKLILQYGFHTLDLHQLYCNVNPENTASMRLFLKHGFVPTGTKKEWVRIQNRWQDEILLQRIYKEEDE